MKKRYISVDIEASGPTPGKYSMVSLGACVVGEESKQFYREIKPISKNLIEGAMKVCSKGLKCLENEKGVDPEKEDFNPEKVMEVLNEKGEDPSKVMREFAEWIKGVSKGFRPVECAAPIKFDGMFTRWYFDNYYEGENPLGHSGEDINSMFRGVVKNTDAHVSQFGFRKGKSHNAVEDAVAQAKEFEKVLEMMKE